MTTSVKISSSRITSSAALLVGFVCVAGCAHESKPAHAAETAPPQPQTTAMILAPASPGKGGSTIYLSDQLRSACGVSTIESVKEAPKFQFDESAIQPDDRDVLAQVAKCLTTGPLKGHSVKLVGRADSRGTQEYNMALGERRSATVEKYLQALGVPASQMVDTSRGALDATGTNEAEWHQDRRVDIDVLSASR